MKRGNQHQLLMLFFSAYLFLTQTQLNLIILAYIIKFSLVGLTFWIYDTLGFSFFGHVKCYN